MAAHQNNKQRIMRQCNNCSHYGDRKEARSLCLIARAWVTYCGICKHYAKVADNDKQRQQ